MVILNQTTQHPNFKVRVTPNATFSILIRLTEEGMQWVGLPKLVAAVSNAGGLGALPQSSHAAEPTEPLQTAQRHHGDAHADLEAVCRDHHPAPRAAIEEGVKICETVVHSPEELIKGHPGEDIVGLVLIASAAKELEISSLAAGGTANTRGMAVAIALGPADVNMGMVLVFPTNPLTGTRFMYTVESPI
ncbi:hypothetical protein B0H19DRAFT_1379006 [Mycena capillaripes]|nr:hypothetical protein B0H19DRAFT_1379006 [Mycena capillaripes]